MQTELYIEDWIGLKSLDDAGRVKYITVPGNHLGISKPDMKKYVVPYLEDDTSKREMQTLERRQDAASAEIITAGSSSYYSFPSYIQSFFEELLGITQDEPVLRS
ncbi:hypothetical protein ACH5RR_038750 [Cinchona calisaya]|uniref:Uncharacterized protein n=1 Tax=Cinchona calisaya TaxID=153742 RepID=A0ABD2XZJ5_9GENT